MDEKELQEIERRMNTGFGEYFDSGKCDEDMRRLIAQIRRMRQPRPKFDGKLSIMSDCIIDGREYKAGDVVTLGACQDGYLRTHDKPL